MTLPHIQVNKEWELDIFAVVEYPPGGGHSVRGGIGRSCGGVRGPQKVRLGVAARRRGGCTLFFLYKNLLAIN
ncbi:MAG TPA: hypothetical protein PKY55_04665 [bacterium]|jgi:hypothetical protein|nr:hypothetical protein [bacterium]